MTAPFTAIDLSLLPVPDVIEALDFETILAALLADFRTRFPGLTPALESDPVIKLLETFAYREVLLRARFNDAARAVLLASARGADLDQLGAWWGVARRTLPTGGSEADEVYRAQIQLSLEAHTSAGTVGAYRWYAQNAAPTALAVGVTQPIAGSVLISILGPAATAGVPSDETLTAVADALTADEVRPLTDTVVVQAADLISYDVTAVLHLDAGPSPAPVLEAATAAVQTYCDGQRKLGARIACSALYAALNQPGVQWVELTAPTSDLVTDETAAPWLSTLAVTVA